MNYETEAWYKLYIRESTEDKVLPVMNRALRDFLLRFAKSREDPTILGKTTNPGEDLARALGAHPSETETIVQFVGTMLEDGYLSHRKGRLWITNFVVAQASRSAGARRQKAYRDRHQMLRNAAQPGNNEPITDVVTVASHVTSQEIRSDPKRDDPRRSETTARAREAAASDPKVPCPPDLSLTSDQIGTLETSGVQREAIAPLTARFIAKAIVDPDDRRTLKVWRKSLASSVSGDWNDPRRRPNPPGAEEHERRQAEASKPVSAATRAVMGNLVREIR